MARGCVCVYGITKLHGIELHQLRYLINEIDFDAVIEINLPLFRLAFCGLLPFFYILLNSRILCCACEKRTEYRHMCVFYCAWVWINEVTTNLLSNRVDCSHGYGPTTHQQNLIFHTPTNFRISASVACPFFTSPFHLFGFKSFFGILCELIFSSSFFFNKKKTAAYVLPDYVPFFSRLIVEHCTVYTVHIEHKRTPSFL